MPKRQPEQLGRAIGYEFNNPGLLHLALTHRSVSKDNNERLEFLGDALLGLIIAEALYKKFPEKSEGELSRMRANLVKGVTLSEIAREFELGDFLHLGIGELKSGGHNRRSILADTFEALLGAIYLDSDFTTSTNQVLRWYASRLDDPKLFDQLKDPKTALQEYCQARQMPLPEYSVLAIKGDQHDQTFYVSCQIAGLPHVTKNSDGTRRAAEQNAASDFLAWLEQDDE